MRASFVTAAPRVARQARAYRRQALAVPTRTMRRGQLSMRSLLLQRRVVEQTTLCPFCEQRYPRRLPGCPHCALLRDSLSGWGRLDVAKAVEALGGPIPPPDRFETNDDAGSQAHTLYGKQVSFTATLDYYDDPIDVYRIALSGGERVNAQLAGSWAGANVGLVLWRPGTTRVNDLSAQKLRAAQSVGPGSTQRVNFKAPGRGWYYVEVKVTSPGYGPYTLTLAKTTPLPR